MKVKVIQDVTISYGPQRVTAGQEIELPDDVAQTLIFSGLAEKIVIPVAPPISKELDDEGGFIVPKEDAEKLLGLFAKAKADEAEAAKQPKRKYRK